MCFTSGKKDCMNNSKIIWMSVTLNTTSKSNWVNNQETKYKRLIYKGINQNVTSKVGDRAKRWRPTLSFTNNRLSLIIIIPLLCINRTKMPIKMHKSHQTSNKGQSIVLLRDDSSVNQRKRIQITQNHIQRVRSLKSYKNAPSTIISITKLFIPQSQRHYSLLHKSGILCLDFLTTQLLTLVSKSSQPIMKVRVK